MSPRGLADRPTCLYWIYGPGRSVLYIGITHDLDERLRQHSEKSWWREVRRIEHRVYRDRHEAAKAERDAIAATAPRYNTMHNPTPSESPAPRRLASLAEAAEVLGVSVRTIRRMVSEGRLTGYRIGSRMLRVDLNDVDALPSAIPTWRQADAS